MISIGFISLFVHSMLMEDLTLVLRWINLHIKKVAFTLNYISLLLNLVKFVLLFDSKRLVSLSLSSNIDYTY